MLTDIDIPTHVGPATAAPAATFDDLFDLGQTALDFDPDLDTIPDPSWVIRARDLASSYPTPGAFARLAKAEFDAGNRVSAIEAAQQVGSMLEVFPEPAATLVAAHVLAACGQHADAERIAASSSDPVVQNTTAPLAARLAAHRGDLDFARGLLEGRMDAVSLELAGTLAIKQSDFPRAIALLRAAVREQEQGADAHTNLSYAYACVGSIKKAHRAAVTAFSLDPTSRVAGINLTASFAARREWDQARRVIDQLLAVHRTDARLWFAKSELYASDGQLARAIQTLSELRSERWLQDGPPVHRAELAAYRAVLKHQNGRATRDEAYDSIRRAARQCNYESPYVLRQLGDFAAHTADRAEIERALLTFQAQESDDDAVVVGARQTLRAKDALLRRDLDSALAVASEWAKSSPADIGAWMLGSFLALANSDPSTTVTFATEGLKRHRQDPILGNNLALALALLGRPDAARNALPTGDSIMLRATAAAIDIAAGRIDDGIAAYDRLATDADRQGTPGVALRVRLWRNIVIARLTNRDAPTVKVPYDDANDVYLELLAGLAGPTSAAVPVHDAPK